MSEFLVIVESPAKAKTIERYLGKKYKVKASMGHVIDLPKSQMGVDIENNYDPDPNDDTYETFFVFLIRENGKLRIEEDLHICGLFELDVWRSALRQTGFEVHEVDLNQEASGLPTFVCVKP